VPLGHPRRGRPEEPVQRPCAHRPDAAYLE
jgi:hypothetical protein